MKIQRFNESLNNDDIINETKNKYKKILELITDFLYSKNRIINKIDRTNVSDINYYLNSDTEIVLSDKYGDNSYITINSDDYNELLLFIENPEIYKNVNKFNI